MSLTTSPIEPAHWMRYLFDLIKDQPFSQVPLPGSHDSGSYGDFYNSSLALTQTLTIEQQLHFGIRYFDFRVRCENRLFSVHHGDVATNNYYLAADGETGILPDIMTFLEEHPGEIVVLDCTHFDNPHGSGFPSVADRNQAFVDLASQIFGGKLIGRGPDGPAETFQSLLGRGQVILITDFSVANDPNGLAWLESANLVDYYNPPSIEAPTGDVGWGGNGTGITGTDMKTLMEDLDEARHGKQDRKRFYKYQAIFNYNAVDINGFESLIQYGAGILNSPVITHYRDLVVESAKSGSPTPNIIIVDFVEMGAVVEAIVDAVYYNWPGASGNGRALLNWRSTGPNGFSDGWVTRNAHSQFLGGNIYAPEQHLVALWVKAYANYGVVDFAPTYVPALGNGINPKPGDSPPMDLKWHYGELFSKVDDIGLVTVPDNEGIVGVEVVNQGGYGIVNVRARSSSLQVSAAAFTTRPTSPWTKGGHPTDRTITAFESAYQGNYGVIDIRYAVRART